MMVMMVTMMMIPVKTMMRVMLLMISYGAEDVDDAGADG